MDLSSLSKDTLISIIRDQRIIIDNYKEKSNETCHLCKCRVWDGFPDKQCSRKGTINGYCKIHNKHVVTWGQWHLGEIGGPIPTYWGEFCGYVPCREKKGRMILSSPYPSYN